MDISYEKIEKKNTLPKDAYLNAVFTKELIDEMVLASERSDVSIIKAPPLWM